MTQPIKPRTRRTPRSPHAKLFGTGDLNPIMKCSVIVAHPADEVVGAGWCLDLKLSVCGTATLPRGLVATIKGPFSASENVGRTTVHAGGRQFVFTPAAITVDGTNVAALDTSVLQVAIDARGYNAELTLNGKRISLPRR